MSTETADGNVSAIPPTQPAADPFCWKVTPYFNSADGAVWKEYSIESPDGPICKGVLSLEIAEEIAALPIVRRALAELPWHLEAPAEPPPAPQVRPQQKRRTDLQHLEGFGQLLEEMLAVQRHILAALGSGSSVPSVELSVDSKALVKPVVKIYDLDPERANQEAQRIFDELTIKYAPKNGADK
jgi:hypothetical protein